MNNKVLFLFVVLFAIFFSYVFVIAQTGNELPEPVSGLPESIAIILGALSSIISEFITTRKSKLVSLAISVLVSVVSGLIGSIFILKLPLNSPDNIAVFIVTVFAMSQTAFGIINGTGTKEKLINLFGVKK